MDWITLLKAQQADFITRLKSGSLLQCEIAGQHREKTVISKDKLKQLRDFSWEMAEKYKQKASVRETFINNLKGNLGEEVVKNYLGDLITDVNYQIKKDGDGKVDFTLTSNPNIGIQVKARHGDIDRVKWSLTKEEFAKNSVLVCILIREEVSEAQIEYNLILAGFLPTEEINIINDRAFFGIAELLYIGGLRYFLENTVAEDCLEEEDICWHQKPIIQAKDSRSLAREIFKRGISVCDLGQYQKAIDDFTTAIELNPHYAEAYNHRGLTFDRLQAYQKAIDDFTTAIELNPHYAEAHHNIAITFKNLENSRSAERFISKAKELYRQEGNLEALATAQQFETSIKLDNAPF